MLFNSVTFLIFFLIVYSLYLLLQGRLRLQNQLLLISSLIFYGWWDWRFLFLMLFNISVDYLVGNALSRAEDPRRRKLLLWLSLSTNLGILGFFKYFNFFLDSLSKILVPLGVSSSVPYLNIILPIGISFYTFQAMSYVIDIYRKTLKPAPSFLEYATFVCYFPQLVAGPIERASHLLPQVLAPRRLTFEKFWEGSYLIGWGLFKKVIIADNLARIVNPVFSSGGPYDGVTVLTALYAFAFQIYCDFSGYSDMARGLGRVMGFDIMWNFNLPYLATNPADFWRRWHISLSTWLRDYLYIPLGGNRKGTLMTYRNLFLTMLLGGLWHGAQWTFVLWGAYHGFLLLLHRGLQPFFQKMPLPKNALWGNLSFCFRTVIFFHLTCLGWLFFRAGSLNQIREMLWGLIFRFRYDVFSENMIFQLIFLMAGVVLIQAGQYLKKDPLLFYRGQWALKCVFWIYCLFALIFFGIPAQKEFIYFQF